MSELGSTGVFSQSEIPLQRRVRVGVTPKSEKSPTIPDTWITITTINQDSSINWLVIAIILRCCDWSVDRAISDIIVISRLNAGNSSLGDPALAFWRYQEISNWREPMVSVWKVEAQSSANDLWTRASISCAFLHGDDYEIGTRADGNCTAVREIQVIPHLCLIGAVAIKIDQTWWKLHSGCEIWFTFTFLSLVL